VLPFAESPTITLTHDGELEHFEPGKSNRPGKVSTIRVSVDDHWVRVGCTKITPEAWKHIVSKVKL
jgi:hypothetical protein